VYGSNVKEAKFFDCEVYMYYYDQHDCFTTCHTTTTQKSHEYEYCTTPQKRKKYCEWSLLRYHNQHENFITRHFTTAHMIIWLLYYTTPEHKKITFWMKSICGAMSAVGRAILQHNNFCFVFFVLAFVHGSLFCGKRCALRLAKRCVLRLAKRCDMAEEPVTNAEPVASWASCMYKRNTVSISF